MVVFEWTLSLLLGAVLLTALARRFEVPYPAVLALAGSALAFMPFMPTLEIEPELALALFIAPILLDAAFDTSPRMLSRHALSLASLALAAVLLTTVAVAVVAMWLAGLPLAAAIALGAIVAPPDAAAAAAVLGQFRPPRRLMAILQGESLLNDASALLIYRMAVAAAGGTLALGSAAPMIALSAFGSIAAGYLLARLYILATERITDSASSTILQFIGTFGVWLFAEQTSLSAIVTMVVYGMTLSHSGALRLPARTRVSSYSVWETAVFVLNVLAFVLMGLQARPILERLSEPQLTLAFTVAGAVLATVIAVRLGWVLATGTAIRMLRGGSFHGSNLRGDLLIGWCGMRGLVTLATAFALPADFPGRDVIVLSAFVVVLGTLVLQGVTLRPLLLALKLPPDHATDAEVSRGRMLIMQAALDTMDGEDSPAAAAMREQYVAACTVASDARNPQAATEYDELRLRAISAQRTALLRLRHEGDIEDEAFFRLQEELDWAELDASPAGRFQPLAT